MLEHTRVIERNSKGWESNKTQDIRQKHTRFQNPVQKVIKEGEGVKKNL